MKKRNTASRYGGRPGDGPGGIQGSDLRTPSKAKPKAKPVPTTTPRPKASTGTQKTKPQAKPKTKPAASLDDKRAARNAANTKRKPKTGVDDQKAARNAADTKPKAAKFTRKGMNASKPASALRKANAGMRNKGAKSSIKNMLSGMDKDKKKPRKVY